MSKSAQDRAKEVTIDAAAVLASGLPFRGGILVDPCPVPTPIPLITLPIAAADGIKYIVTGRRLGEKK